MGKPTKCLESVFNESLGGQNIIWKIQLQVKEGLWYINRSGLLETFKMWVYQHKLLPRFIWQIKVNVIILSAMEAMD